MKIKVIVTLKDGVLDPQGKAIQQTLNGMSFSNIDEVRQGKSLWKVFLLIACLLLLLETWIGRPIPQNTK